MSKIDDGGAAFPRAGNAQWGGAIPEWQGAQGGMSLRDWLAGQALAGTLTIYGPMPAEDWASQAYEIADAMLVARKKEPGA